MLLLLFMLLLVSQYRTNDLVYVDLYDDPIQKISLHLALPKA